MSDLPRYAAFPTNPANPSPSAPSIPFHPICPLSNIPPPTRLPVQLRPAPAPTDRVGPRDRRAPMGSGADLRDHSADPVAYGFTRRMLGSSGSSGQKVQRGSFGLFEIRSGFGEHSGNQPRYSAWLVWCQYPAALITFHHVTIYSPSPSPLWF